MRRHGAYLVLLVVGCTALATLALLNHRALGTGYDLGIYDQVVWNMAHGRPFATTLVYETGGYYDHFEPVLALIGTLYWAWSDVRVLLILQALALALGSLPIYLYARRRLGGYWPFPPLIALLPVVIYLAYPPLHSANLNDFHEVALLPPILGFALYGLLTGQRRVMLIALALGLMVKEDFAVTALSFAIYIAVLRPAGFRRRDGVWLGLAVLAWGILVLYVFYPTETHGMPYPFVTRRYSWLGDSPASAVQGLMAQPGTALAHLLQPPKLVFLFRLFAPLLFLPLLGWRVLILALPVLTYLMLSEYQPQWSVQSYYNPPLLAFLFFALVEAVAMLGGWAARWRRPARRLPAALLAAALLATGYSYHLFAPGPGGRDYRSADFSLSEQDRAAYTVLAHVPPGASISAIWSMVPHLSERQQIYTTLQRPVEAPEYRLVMTRQVEESAPLFPLAAPPGIPPVYNEYRPVFAAGPYVLERYVRALPMTPLPEPDPAPGPLTLAGFAWPETSAGQEPTVAPREAARLLLAWHRHGQVNHRYVVFAHVLKPGSGDILTQADHEPGDGRYPTTLWNLWTNPSIVLDELVLEVPDGAPPGKYEVWAGAYDRDTKDRIEVGGSGETLVRVGDLTVR